MELADAFAARHDVDRLAEQAEGLSWVTFHRPKVGWCVRAECSERMHVEFNTRFGGCCLHQLECGESGLLHETQFGRMRATPVSELGRGQYLRQ